MYMVKVKCIAQIFVFWGSQGLTDVVVSKKVDEMFHWKGLTYLLN